MTYSEIRARAREAMRGHWGISIGAAFVASIFGALLAHSGNILQLTEHFSEEAPPSLAAVLVLIASAASALSLVKLIVGGVVQLGYCRFLLRQHDGKAYELKDLFSQFDRFSVGFLQAFLRSLYIILWAMLLIVPGIIKGYSYAMTPFILTDNPQLTAGEAIRQSQVLMKGHKGELFVLSLTFIGWDLLSALTLGIGSLWLNPYKNAAYAAFYRELTAAQPQSYAEF